MEIIGRGFIAQNLRAIAGKHPHVVALASGVSQVDGVSSAEYQREAELVYETIARCQRQDKTLLFFSTASAGMYDAMRGCRGREDDPVYPGNSHGRNKLLLETVIRSSGVRFLILRLSHAFGVHQASHQLIPSLYRAVLSGRVRIHRGASRDIIHVFDAVTIVDYLLAADIAYQVVNVASGVTIPSEAIIDHLAFRLRRTIEERTVVDGDASVCLVSLEKLQKLVPAVIELGFGDNYYKTALDRYIAGSDSVGVSWAGATKAGRS